MKVLTHIHNYSPNTYSGADKMAQALNEFLAKKGCEVVCIVDVCDQPYTLNGVYVTNNRLIAERYDWADIIITHLVTHGLAQQLAIRFNKPIFHVVHNDNTAAILGQERNYIIYNSVALQKTVPINLPFIIVNPPVFAEDWSNNTNHYEEKYITMVNMTDNKGAEMFYQLALHFPRWQFMGVYGGYGAQYQQTTPSNNLRYHRFTPDMKDIYEQTRIVLIPSKKESWSMVGAEAQASGIPVICSDLPGLRENLGEAAIYCRDKRSFMDSLSTLVHERWIYDDMVKDGLKNARSKPHLEQLEKMYLFMKEQVVVGAGTVGVPEKKELPPVKEKVEIKKPGTKKKIVKT